MPAPSDLREHERQLRDTSRNILAKLFDLNQAFPETRRFMKQEGIESVEDLDRTQMRKLLLHLNQLYRRCVH